MKRSTVLKYLKLTPFIIVISILIIYVLDILIWNLTQDSYSFLIIDEVKYSFWGITPVLIFIFLKKSVWKFLFSIVLMAAVLQYIQFYGTTFVLTIGFFKIEFKSFLLLIAHVVLNFDQFNIFHITRAEQKEKENSEEKENGINFFEIKFQNKSKSELIKIVEEAELVPEALDAASRLLNKFDAQ